jgi:hypothetical protein
MPPHFESWHAVARVLFPLNGWHEKQPPKSGTPHEAFTGVELVKNACHPCQEI